MPTHESAEQLPHVFVSWEAEHSAYWTGRFVAMSDRLACDELLPPNINPNEETDRSPLSMRHHEFIPSIRTRTSDSPLQYRSLPLSNTTAGLSTLRDTHSRPLTDTEDRSRRVFDHLEKQCITPEARASLHQWQEKYARAVGKPQLLPPGVSMSKPCKNVGVDKDKKLLSKIFGNGGQDKGEKQSFATLREMTSTRLGRKARSEGKGKKSA